MCLLNEISDSLVGHRRKSAKTKSPLIGYPVNTPEVLVRLAAERRTVRATLDVNSERIRAAGDLAAVANPLLVGSAWYGFAAEGGPTEETIDSAEMGKHFLDEIRETGAVLAGRNTVEQTDHWGGDHHDGVPIFVPSHRLPGPSVAKYPWWPM